MATGKNEQERVATLKKSIMATRKPFSKDIILLENVEKVIENIIEQLRSDVLQRFKRRGAVIGISGGIDSSVCLALAAKAFGPDRVLGVMLPEKDSNPDSEILARELASRFGIRAIKEEITGALAGFGCYERRGEGGENGFPGDGPEKREDKIGKKEGGVFKKNPPHFFFYPN